MPRKVQSVLGSFLRISLWSVQKIYESSNVSFLVSNTLLLKVFFSFFKKAIFKRRPCLKVPRLYSGRVSKSILISSKLSDMWIFLLQVQKIQCLTPNIGVVYRFVFVFTWWINSVIYFKRVIYTPILGSHLMPVLILELLYKVMGSDIVSYLNLPLQFYNYLAIGLQVMT